MAENQEPERVSATITITMNDVDMDAVTALYKYLKAPSILCAHCDVTLRVGDVRQNQLRKLTRLPY